MDNTRRFETLFSLFFLKNVFWINVFYGGKCINAVWNDMPIKCSSSDSRFSIERFSWWTFSDSGESDVSQTNFWSNEHKLFVYVFQYLKIFHRKWRHVLARNQTTNSKSNETVVVIMKFTECAVLFRFAFLFKRVHAQKPDVHNTSCDPPNDVQCSSCLTAQQAIKIIIITLMCCKGHLDTMHIFNPLI